MLPRSCWVLLLLCAAARFFGWLGLSTHPEKLGTPLELGAPPEVVVRLCSSCTHLSEEEEEELNKLGVDLSNCRATKGHQTSPCTPDVEGQERPKLETPIHRSLQWLEETLVTSGQLRMAQLMQDITQAMGNVSTHGAAGLRQRHQVVLSDLHCVQERAQDIHFQLGESDLNLLLAQQHQMEEVMGKLQRVNRSLGLMLVAMEGARNQLDNHLQYLHANLDPAGQSPSVTSCILHGSCFMLLVTLLVPTSPRVTLLLLFLASSTLSKLLSIMALSALLLLAVAGQWLVATRRDAEETWPVFPRHRLTSTPDREHEMKLLQEELDRMEMSCLQEPSVLEQPPMMAHDVPSLGRLSPVPGGWRTKLSSCGAMLDLTPGVKPYSPTQSPANNGSLLSPRSPCQGLTKVGQRCRKKAILGQDFCHVHTTSRTSCSSLVMD